MKRILAVAVLSGWSMASMAGSVDGVNTLNQSEFGDLSKDLTAAFSYKAGAPARPLGIASFDVGIAVTMTDLEYTAVWDKAVSSGGMNTLTVPKLYLQVGLPFAVDIGAYYLNVPNSNLEAWGGELKYAIFDDGTAMPAVAVRGSVTSLFGADQFTLDTRSIDFSISQGISLRGLVKLNPYAGLGHIWSSNAPQGNAVGVLNEVNLSENRTFIGLSLGLATTNVAVERDSVDGIVSYSFKLGFAF